LGRRETNLPAKKTNSQKPFIFSFLHTTCIILELYFFVEPTWDGTFCNQQRCGLSLLWGLVLFGTIHHQYQHTASAICL
jgi:hypothetical protein